MNKKNIYVYLLYKFVNFLEVNITVLCVSWLCPQFFQSFTLTEYWGLYLPLLRYGGSGVFLFHQTPQAQHPVRNWLTKSLPTPFASIKRPFSSLVLNL